jgi:hypothetical protein
LNHCSSHCRRLHSNCVSNCVFLDMIARHQDRSSTFDGTSLRHISAMDTQISVHSFTPQKRTRLSSAQEGDNFAITCHSLGAPHSSYEPRETRLARHRTISVPGIETLTPNLGTVFNISCFVFIIIQPTKKRESVLA